MHASTFFTAFALAASLASAAPIANPRPVDVTQLSAEARRNAEAQVWLNHFKRQQQA